VTRPWQLYPVFLVMAGGWGATSGAAINIIVAPWWERRRGLAVSIAFNGATLGGVLVTPGLILLIDARGFTAALRTGAIVLLLLVVVPLAVGVMRRAPGSPRAAPPASGERRWRRDAMSTWRFWSVSAAFALGLCAQVGVLTHLVALVTPALGMAGAARAVSLTTTAALLGRLATGLVVDRLDRRRVASATLVTQVAGVVLLASAWSPPSIYLGCALFGLGVGNLTTLPGLIVAAEWPRERFAALVGLVVGINQLTFAFGPTLVGVVRDGTGTYGAALAVCATLEAVAAVVILLRPAAHVSRGTG
jgi:predicted MFS family arabinose efflux permease